MCSEVNTHTNGTETTLGLAYIKSDTVRNLGGTVRSQPTRVLLIEDNEGDANLVRMRLQEGDADLELSRADRLSTALAALETAPPAVILLDLNLPDSDGAETFRNLLNKAPAMPVVVLSAIDDEEIAVQAMHHRV